MQASGTAFLQSRLLSRLYVDSASSARVLRISFDIESNSLTLVQSLEAVGYDSGEMYEYVLAALVVGNEAEALICVKPFYCTFAHVRYLLKNFNKF